MLTDLTGASDAQLVLLVARFEESALAELYRRHAGAVFGLARRLLSEPGAAEDVVQDVFVRLWSEPERFDPARGALRSYLLARTHSRSIDILRAEGSRRRREERDAKQAAEAGYDVEREVWDMTLAAHVRAALGELPDPERKVIELAYFGGHTYREVAEMLGQPEGTVKGRIRNGLRRMHASLSGSAMVVARGDE